MDLKATHEVQCLENQWYHVENLKSNLIYNIIQSVQSSFHFCCLHHSERQILTSRDSTMTVSGSLFRAFFITKHNETVIFFLSLCSCTKTNDLFFFFFLTHPNYQFVQRKAWCLDEWAQVDISAQPLHELVKRVNADVNADADLRELVQKFSLSQGCSMFAFSFTDQEMIKESFIKRTPVRSGWVIQRYDFVRYL